MLINTLMCWLGRDWSHPYCSSLALVTVLVHWLCHFPAALIVSCCLCACRTNQISQLSIVWWKTMQKTLLFFNASDDRTFLNQFLPLSMRWLIVGCLLKKAQASQKFVSTSKRPRSNQVLVKNVDWNGGSQTQGYWKLCYYLLGLHRILK